MPAGFVALDEDELVVGVVLEVGVEELDEVVGVVLELVVEELDEVVDVVLALEVVLALAVELQLWIRWLSAVAPSPRFLTSVVETPLRLATALSNALTALSA